MSLTRKRIVRGSKPLGYAVVEKTSQPEQQSLDCSIDEIVEALLEYPELPISEGVMAIRKCVKISDARRSKKTH